MIDTEDKIDILREHLEQSFDKVSFITDMYECEITITAVKGGKTATYVQNDNFKTTIKFLDNIKYELLKNL